MKMLRTLQKFLSQFDTKTPGFCLLSDDELSDPQIAFTQVYCVEFALALKFHFGGALVGMYHKGELRHCLILWGDTCCDIFGSRPVASLECDDVRGVTLDWIAMERPINRWAFFQALRIIRDHEADFKKRKPK